MRIHSIYHFDGVNGVYAADPVDVMTVLYEFDSKDEMDKSGLLTDPRRTTSFTSSGKYYVGGHFEATEGETNERE